ncbi:hypothetical protein ACWDLG_38780 [Nonomuraea sp. NPDC003727]
MRRGIAVTPVCPGGVDTPLTDTVEIAGVDQRPRRPGHPYGW